MGYGDDSFAGRDYNNGADALGVARGAAADVADPAVGAAFIMNGGSERESERGRERARESERERERVGKREGEGERSSFARGSS